MFTEFISGIFVLIVIGVIIGMIISIFTELCGIHKTLDDIRTKLKNKD